ncbi:NAD(P)/FAD-dependent oxidoreductase [Acidipropionibacterium acidipropionici]|uniref:Pyridine nucleotide-disulfide oxidoreductase n=1 Tax=Acidipropionibacterium acidipropionici TaxID=1748 RepID=A0AAC8YG82_9ACTN|nr:NAD(P)-binding domain-containing protein [Acidipropionibacterium acidipropionici]AMS06033.1 pyridine nucleotide-disulfide oxidoreductase [Acidipropionibacterium acidipropionici]AOZ47496.1 pyridine nucleotide-disulfide oxidoreductase [Acidipropionibacterium acidipropionici]AZP39185.1 NAD(P)/FAD-dependent oxidoreductase [Acidipropionibacterium acidipropionici]
MREATVVVIGAGQAGLSAGYHLARRDFQSALSGGGSSASGERLGRNRPTFVVLDANPAPGGAWQHRWESLHMATVNGIFDLPGFPAPHVAPEVPSRDAVPAYFSAFENRNRLPILRPTRVAYVRRIDDDPEGDLVVETDTGQWWTRAIINATGTWNNPVLPQYPGGRIFTGRQLHTRDYVSADEFAGQRVAIVGGGISAVQQLEEISRGATTFWYTRREPVFRDGSFRPEFEGREIIARITAAVEAGAPPGSIVANTGPIWSPYAIAARDRGVLARRPMFTAIEPEGLREADGSFTPVDAILWATGFRPDLSHLDPLHLKNDRGGIEMRGTQVLAGPRVHLIGYGPSQSTVGANRAGRDAVRVLSRLLGDPLCAGRDA